MSKFEQEQIRAGIQQGTINALRPRQNGRHFADDTFKGIFMNENVRISINISLKFVPKGLINNILALVQIMAWRRPGDKPLSEPLMVGLQTHICVTRPQWVNSQPVLVRLIMNIGYYVWSHTNIMLNLFDALIKPILIYGSDVWGIKSKLWGEANKIRSPPPHQSTSSHVKC